MRSTPALSLFLLLLACGSSPPPVPPPIVQDVEPAPAADVRDPRIVRAMANITEADLRARLTRVIGPRDIPTAVEHHQAVAQYFEDELTAAGYTVTRQTVEHGEERADNIIAERIGRDPSRVVLVGAHYDTVANSPGADDNASGTVATLAIARAIADIPTDATVRFVAFCFEEDWMVGSSAYVRALPQPIEVAITLDMIAYYSNEPGSQRWPQGAELLARGRDIPSVGNFIGAFWLTDTPRDIIRRFEAATVYAPDLNIETLAIPRLALTLAPDVGRSDHAPFWEARIPAISIGDSGPFRNPYYHGAADTIDTLNLPFYTQVTQWLAAAVLLIAEPAPRE
jgi:Zn-dependent M28 family amino/carboxypeptidase